jgi:hypothetical protein
VAVLESVATVSAGTALLFLVQGLVSWLSASFEGANPSEPCALALPGSEIAWGAFCARRTYWFGEEAHDVRLFAGETAWPRVEPLGLRSAWPCRRPQDTLGTTIASGADAHGMATRIRAGACLGAAAIATGIARGALAEAESYAAHRYQGGDIIARLPIVQAMLGRARASTRRARLLVQAAATRWAEADFEADALSVFLGASSEATSTTTCAVQILGGYGYMQDYGAERRWRDARALASLLGAAERNAIHLAGAAS